MADKPDILCPEHYIGKCYTYFYSIFNDNRYYFNRNKVYYNFKDKIDEIDDPILRHITIYLIANYDEAQKYFSNDGKWQNNPACESLNKWLDNKKHYFTYGLHCNGNVHLWNKTIEPIWEQLEKKSKSNSNYQNKWCKRYNFFREYLKLPDELNPPICYKHVPKGYKCVRPFPRTKCSLYNTCNEVRTYYNKCKSKGYDVNNVRSKFAEDIANGVSPLKSMADVTFTRQVQNHCCPSLEYAVPISVCLSFFVTLLIIFLLKKFTPLGSKLLYKGINKKVLRDNFKEQLEYEEYARSMNKNPHREPRRNNIYYHSVRK